MHLPRGTKRVSHFKIRPPEPILSRKSPSMPVIWDPEAHSTERRYSRTAIPRPAALDSTSLKVDTMNP